MKITRKSFIGGVSTAVLVDWATFRKDRLVLDMKPIDTVLIRLDRQIAGVE